MTTLAPLDPKHVPRSAMRFANAKPMQFAAGDADTGVLPFRMLARSADAIEHDCWGSIIHDLSGMIIRKDSVTVDWMHGFDEVIGFANQFSVTENGLEVSGSLVTTAPNDKADEVYRKGKAGVPYEASIDWNGPEVEIEYIPEGVTTEVNAQQFAGPGYVVRKWPLRAISICRYGCDPDTRTQFSKTSTEPDTVSVSITLPETETATVAESSTAPAAPAVGTPPAVTDGKQFAEKPGVITIDTLKQFSTEFGDKANEYLTAGLSLDTARYQFAVHKRDEAEKQFAALQKQTEVDKAAAAARITDLETKLKQFGVDALGQDKPVDTDGKPPEDAAAAAKQKQFSLVGGDNRAKFAVGMKLRGEA